MVSESMSQPPSFYFWWSVLSRVALDLGSSATGVVVSRPARGLGGIQTSECLHFYVWRATHLLFLRSEYRTTYLSIIWNICSDGRIFRSLGERHYNYNQGCIMADHTRWQDLVVAIYLGHDSQPPWIIKNKKLCSTRKTKTLRGMYMCMHTKD